MLTSGQFRGLFPRCEDPGGWVRAMRRVFPQYDITSTQRIAAFIAQCGHESGGWRTFSENLNYSEKALNVVFPKYFVRADRGAWGYARQPEKIANVVYAGRMGNGSIESGDGWEFRGRGPIQLTGRDNYEAFSEDMGIWDLLDYPDLVSEDKEIALLSALWFWNRNNLNDFADTGDIRGMTRRINGGYNGLEDRIQHYHEVLGILGQDAPELEECFEDDDEPDFEHPGTLRRGSRGDGVRMIQEILGLFPDGVFGQGTERAIKTWQRSVGLYVDGIVGPRTLDKLLG